MKKKRKLGREHLRDSFLSAPDLRKCEAKDEDTCRALYCPKNRGNKAYCPWEKNGRVNSPPQEKERAA